MNATTRTVVLSTRTVGRSFGTRGVVRDANTGRVITTSETVRPFGFTGSALDDARAVATKRGWTIGSAK